MKQSIEICITDDRIHHWGLPRYMTDLSAGIDLFACIPEACVISPQQPAQLISSGIAVLISQPDIAALILPRSGLGHRGLILGNAVGLIDADYSATIFISVWNRNAPESPGIYITPGDRIAQLVFIPIIRAQFTVVDHFATQTQRGSGGFGSTGV